jgi:chemotaxis protein MotB
MRGPKRSFSPSRPIWLLTFADLTTLLLVLFLMIFSMSSLDNFILRSISSGLDTRKGLPGEAFSMPENIRLAAQLLQERDFTEERESRIRALLFPAESLPPDFDKGTLEDSIRILPRLDGIMFSLDNGLLFEPGSSGLTAEGRNLLRNLAALMYLLPGEVQLCGHEESGGSELGADGKDPYQASAARVLTALGVFVHQGHAPELFSVSAYGGDKPPDPSVTRAGRMRARIEILFKNGNNSYTETRS